MGESTGIWQREKMAGQVQMVRTLFDHKHGPMTIVTRWGLRRPICEER